MRSKRKKRKKVKWTRPTVMQETRITVPIKIPIPAQDAERLEKIWLREKGRSGFPHAKISPGEEDLLQIEDLPQVEVRDDLITYDEDDISAIFSREKKLYFSPGEIVTFSGGEHGARHTTAPYVVVKPFNIKQVAQKAMFEGIENELSIFKRLRDQGDIALIGHSRIHLGEVKSDYKDGIHYAYVDTTEGVNL